MHRLTDLNIIALGMHVDEEAVGAEAAAFRWQAAVRSSKHFL